MLPTQSSRQFRRIRAVLVVATIVAGGCSSGSQGSGDENQGDSSGEPTLASIDTTPLGDASKLQLGTATDLPTVVNVWATWCVPCRKEMPAFDAVAARYEGTVHIVGINLGEEPAAAQKFVDETGISFDQYLDPDSTAQAALSITNMPATAFVRADGTLATTHNGALDEQELEALLAEQLGVDAPAG